MREHGAKVVQIQMSCTYIVIFLTKKVTQKLFLSLTNFFIDYHEKILKIENYVMAKYFGIFNKFQNGFENEDMQIVI